jgi:hypothetical protein
MNNFTGPSGSFRDTIRESAQLFHDRHENSLINAELAKLQPGHFLFVTSDGSTHTVKDSIVSGVHEPLISFFKNSDGSVVAYAGLPARNQTLCWATTPTEDPKGIGTLIEGMEDHQLVQPTILCSGNTLQICTTKIRIPDEPILHPKADGDRFAQLLATAQPGDDVRLGRMTVPECRDPHISRVHCIARILTRDTSADGNFTLKIRIFPGIPTAENLAQQIKVQRDDGTQEPLGWQKTLAPGTQVFLGNGVGSIVIPPPPGAADPGQGNLPKGFRP